MKIELDVTILIDYEERTSKETFRACGTTWVRYERRNGENGYATATEWEEWLSRGRVMSEFRQPGAPN